jgi:hypothetical protein
MLVPLSWMSVKGCSAAPGATFFLARILSSISSSCLSINDYNRTMGTFRLSLPLPSLHWLEILALSGPTSLTCGCRRSSPGEHVVDSKPGFLSVWRREQGMERGLGASRRFQISSRLDYGTGSLVGDFLSSRGSELPRSGSSSIIAKPSGQSSPRYVA